MQLVVEDFERYAPVVLRPEHLTDDDFFEYCHRYEGFRVERTASGEIEIMPPTGLETGFRNSDLTAQLHAWAVADGRGVALDSNTEFILPNGAARSPDASWVLRSRFAKLTREQRQKFAKLCPDFVVELKSPSDRLPVLQAKMREWIENGAQVAWLLDCDTRTAYIYQAGTADPETITNPASLTGKAPVDTFTLRLEALWAGLGE